MRTQRCPLLSSRDGMRGDLQSREVPWDRSHPMYLADKGFMNKPEGGWEAEREAAAKSCE